MEVRSNLICKRYIFSPRASLPSFPFCNISAKKLEIRMRDSNCSGEADQTIYVTGVEFTSLNLRFVRKKHSKYILSCFKAIIQWILKFFI